MTLNRFFNICNNKLIMGIVTSLHRRILFYSREVIDNQMCLWNCAKFHKYLKILLVGFYHVILSETFILSYKTKIVHGDK